MFYDVRVIIKKKGRTIVIVRKVFSKKRKRNKIAGLERNYVATERKYVVTDERKFNIPARGRITVLLKNGEIITFELLKNDSLTITQTGDWEITGPKRY